MRWGWIIIGIIVLIIIFHPDAAAGAVHNIEHFFNAALN